MNNILISVIIPVYNGERYIKQAIESVIKQQSMNFELIIVNDGSTDNTLFIINDILQKNNVDATVINSPNRGSSAARNLGIENAHGDYILFLDSDDYLDTSLANNLSLTNFIDYDIFFYGFNDVDDSGNILRKYSDRFVYIRDTTGRDGLINNLNRNIWICHGNALFRRSLIQNNNVRYLPETQHGEDMYFICLLLSVANRVGCSHFTGINIRYRSDSIMHSPYNEKFDKTIYAAKELYKKIINNPIYKNDNLITNILSREILEQITYVCKKMIISQQYSFNELVSRITSISNGEFCNIKSIKKTCSLCKYIEYFILSRSVFAYICVVKIYKLFK